MSESANNAVFLSYASQDALAVERIAGALRAAGIEVWFDKNELVGGDAWDAKIRGQIASCALFVPIISSNTQARLEGYFRIEWKLAAQRTHAMAEEKTFLLPVVIDATRDAEAKVPAEFRAVQWTRLSGGTVTPQFIEQVKRLLGPVALDTPRSPPAAPIARQMEFSAGGRAQTNRPRRTAPGWIGFALGAAALALVGYIALRPAVKTPAVPAAFPAEAKTASAPNLPSDKSIAVLPFVNLSPDKDNEFFADGIHEDVLGNLQNIRELRVVSRTSVMGYRGTTKKIGEIARELNVAYILESSVRRDGSTVRVSTKLIDARTDAPLWSPPPYDRELSATGVFKIQSEIAQSIASALHTRLSPQEKSLIEQRPTENLAAYDLYLKSRGFSASTLPASEALLQAAVQLDPNFAVAWASLSRVHGLFYSNLIDQSPARLVKAKAAIDVAVRLAPDHPEVIHSLGRYYYAGFRDYARALEHFERVARMQPNNADIWHSIGAVHRRQGRWLECLADFRRGVQLDPGELGNAIQYAITLQRARRYEEARSEFRRIASRRIASRRSEKATVDFDLALISFQATGSVAEGNALMAQFKEMPEESGMTLPLRKRWAVLTGNFAEYARLDRIKPGDGSEDFQQRSLAAALVLAAQSERSLAAALVLAAQGELAAARARVPDLRPRLEQEPLNASIWSQLGMGEVLLGHKDEALRCARKAIELIPESVDAWTGAVYRANLAFVYAWTGDKDRAIAEYARLLHLPYSGLNVHEMKRDPTFFPLQGDPRFEALLNDPKNNAPLF